MSKDDESAARTRQQVDKAVRWLEKCYFTEESAFGLDNSLDEV